MFISLCCSMPNCAFALFVVCYLHFFHEGTKYMHTFMRLVHPTICPVIAHSIFGLCIQNHLNSSKVIRSCFDNGSRLLRMCSEVGSKKQMIGYPTLSIHLRHQIRVCMYVAITSNHLFSHRSSSIIQSVHPK